MPNEVKEINRQITGQANVSMHARHYYAIFTGAKEQGLLPVFQELPWKSDRYHIIDSLHLDLICISYRL